MANFDDEVDRCVAAGTAVTMIRKEHTGLCTDPDLPRASRANIPKFGLHISARLELPQSAAICYLY